MPIDTDERLIAKLDEIAAEHDRLTSQLESPEVASDHRRVRAVSIKRAALDSIVRAYDRFSALSREVSELEDARAGEDPDLAAMARDELPEARDKAERALEEIKRLLVSSDDLVVGSIILEIRAGTGGSEATLWTRDLLSVYTRYAERNGWRVEDMECVSEPTVGGVRHAVVTIAGQGVWQRLGFEGGVHAVKRVPETETQGRVHTSTCTVAVLPEPEEPEVAIDWADDVQEHITTAQGPGGQNVNKVATAVHLIHTPTGIEVRMQESKSQAQNREKARRVLSARVHEAHRAEQTAGRDAARREQIGTAQRSEKIRVYRYQDGIVADERLDAKFTKSGIIDDADLDPLIDALIEKQTTERLSSL